SDALPAGHPGRPDPLALPGPVHRGPPDLLGAGWHADLRDDLKCAAHDLRLLTVMERSGGRPPPRPSAPAENFPREHRLPFPRERRPGLAGLGQLAWPRTLARSSGARPSAAALSSGLK